jgi:hypothetical protein
MNTYNKPVKNYHRLQQHNQHIRKIVNDHLIQTSKQKSPTINVRQPRQQHTASTQGLVCLNTYFLYQRSIFWYPCFFILLRSVTSSTELRTLNV